MSSPDDANLENVAKIATTRADIDRIALIGVFGVAGALDALIRESDGDIVRVGVGSKAAGGTVTAIDDDRVIITKRGGNFVLTMPKA